MKSYLPEIEDKLDKLIDRLDALMPVYAERIVNDINPTEKGNRYTGTDAIEAAIHFRSRMGESVHPKQLNSLKRYIFCHSGPLTAPSQFGRVKR